MYVLAGLQKATGTTLNTSGKPVAATASLGSFDVNSGTDTQTLIAIGVRHRFQRNESACTATVRLWFRDRCSGTLANFELSFVVKAWLTGMYADKRSRPGNLSAFDRKIKLARRIPHIKWCVFIQQRGANEMQAAKHVLHVEVSLSIHAYGFENRLRDRDGLAHR